MKLKKSIELAPSLKNTHHIPYYHLRLHDPLNSQYKPKKAFHVGYHLKKAICCFLKTSLLHYYKNRDGFQ